MFSRLALLASLLAAATAEYGCSSFSQLTHTSSGCPANQGNPDCSFIQANAAQFCSTTATSWEIINGPNCNLRGASYGCIYATGLYSTTDQFCCPLIVTGGAPATSATASASASASASVSASASASASASVTVTADATVSTSASASASVTGSPDASISTTTSASPSASASASALSSPSALTTATSTSTPTLVLLTNYTNTTNVTTNVTATSKTVDRNLTEGDKIGMGIGISIAIIIFIGCCYFGCIITRRPKKSEEIFKLERRPSQAERRPSRSASKLEIRAPTTPRAESKV